MDLIKTMEKYAKEHDVPIMQEEGIHFLCDFIKKHEVKTILELGSAIGYSAIRMAQLDESIKIVTIERDDERYKEACKNIEQAGLSNRIEIIHGDALETEISGEFDLLFIDAAKAQYIKFFEKYTPNVKKEGYILSDNLKFHGFVEHTELIESRNLRQLVRKIKNYIDYLKELEGFDTTFYEFGDGVAISQKNKILNELNFVLCGKIKIESGDEKMKKILPTLAIIGGAIAYTAYKLKKDEKQKIVDLDQDLLIDDKVLENNNDIVTAEKKQEIEEAEEVQEDKDILYDEKYSFVTVDKMEEIKNKTDIKINDYLNGEKNLDKERAIQHNISFTNENDMLEFRSEVINKGYVITRGDNEFSLYVLHIIAINEEKLSKHIYYLANEAYKHHGEYEGWDSKSNF